MKTWDIFPILICIMIMNEACLFSKQEPSDCTNVPKQYHTNTLENNIYSSQDTIIVIKNSRDTILFLKKSVVPNIYQKYICNDMCLMSGACALDYDFTTFTINYVSQDFTANISITRDFYTVSRDFNTSFDDQYEYKVDTYKYTLPGKSSYLFGSKNNNVDTIFKNGKEIIVSKLSTFKYTGNKTIDYSYIYLDGERIAKHIDLQTGDTLDFIN